MLLRQHGGGGQHRHLFSRRDRFEDGADGHFRLAETDISADQTIHRPCLLHVALHIGGGLQLIRRRFIGERFLQLVLPGTITGKGEAIGLMPLRVELHKVHRHFADRFFGSLLGLRPGGTAHLAELWRRFTGGPIAAETAQLIRRDAQQSVGVLHHEVIAHIA